MQRSQLRSAAASLVGGALLAGGFPPFDLAPLAWVGVGLLLWSWRSADTTRSALVSGYVGGLAFFGGLFWWLLNVELIAFVPLWLVQSLFFLWPAWVARRFATKSPWVWAGGVVGAWALSEMVRLRAPAGGFPWGELGLLIESTPLRISAHLIGASGWTVVIVGVAAVGVLVVVGDLRRRAMAGAGLVVAGIGVLGMVTELPLDGPELDIVVVQGNSPCPGSSCRNERQLIFESHLALTRMIEAGEGGPELVIWPESSTGFSSDPLINPEVASLIGAEARRLGAYMLIGGDLSSSDNEFINSNLLVDPSGTIVAEYRKTHPVPFGEYVPIRRWFEWIPALDQVPRDMVRGPGPVTFGIGGVPVGSVISYEGSFARYPREAVRNGAGLVVVATNQASFGDGPASDQFLAMSRVRSAELGIDVVHAAVTGKSAVLYADGRVAGPTGLFQAETLSATVRPRLQGSTVYTVLGDWVSAAAVLGGLMLLVGGGLRHRRAMGVPG